MCRFVAESGMKFFFARERNCSAAVTAFLLQKNLEIMFYMLYNKHVNGYCGELVS